jgi:acyl-CoA synthetase (NDP forming)
VQQTAPLTRDGTDGSLPAGEFADLTVLMAPASLAIVGASQQGLGGNLTRNVLERSDFSGPVHLISASQTELFGRPALPSLDAVAGQVDVALIAVPRQHVPGALRAAQSAGARFSVVMSAGFAEAADETGLALDAEIREIIAAGQMRMVGPNCPGVGDIRRPLGLTIQPGFGDELQAGPVGVIAQSGGLTRCILQANHRGVGFSCFFSPGNQADLDVADYLHFLVSDPGTEAIAMAVEKVPSAARFAVAAHRARAAGKPVVLLKSGRSEAGRAAAASHTGAVVGSQAAAAAVARELGVTLVEDVNDLINVTAYRRLASRLQPPRGRNVIVLGMSGGSGVVVTDALAEHGVGLTELSPQTRASLREALPPAVPVSNPLDLADASFKAGAFSDSLRFVTRDPAAAAVLVMFNAWYEGHTERFTEACLEVAPGSPVPVIPVWMSARGGPERTELEQAGLLPCRSATEAAVVARALVTPQPAVTAVPPPRTGPGASGLAGGALPPGTILEDRAKDLLARAGIRTTREQVVTTPAGAAEAAADLGYPVIVKGLHPGATHRAGTGLVSGAISGPDQLAVAWQELSAAAARAGIAGLHVLVAEFITGEIEAYIGLKRDPEWGMMLSFGLGGRWIEEIADANVVPVTGPATGIAAALAGSKLDRVMTRAGTPAEVRKQLVTTVERVAELAAQHPEISELDINPVILSATAAVAVDALISVG